MKLYSLRQRTLRAFIAPLLIASALIVVVAGIVTYFEISRQHDEEMRKVAALLLVLGKHEGLERDVLGDAESGAPLFPQQIPGSDAEYRISSDAREVVRSSEMPDFPAVSATGFRDIAVGDQIWHVLTLHQTPATPDESALTIDVAERMSARRNQAGRLILAILLPVALLVVAVTWIGSRQVIKVIQPIAALSADVDSRDANDLRQIDYTEVSLELAPLINALNQLLLRIGQAIEREREFTDNAAHELRTPMATLKARAQILQHNLAGTPALAEDVGQFVLSVDRAAIVVERLPELARLSGDNLQVSNFDLSAALQDEARTLAPALLGNGIEFSVDIAAGVILIGAEEALRIALRNLLINAAKFTPKNGAITLKLALHGDQISIEVADSGPGIPEGSEQRIFERFWRGANSPAGSGLGLSLVQRVATLHGGTASAQNIQPHGLLVKMIIAQDASRQNG